MSASYASRRRVWGLGLLVLPLLAGCLVQPRPDVVGPTPTATAAPLPPVGGRIAFLSDRNDGKRELWVINPDGSRETRLLPGRAMSGIPVWSPDGTRLAYVADAAGKAQIGVLLLNADNTPGQTAILTPDAASGDNTNPVWSPDGRQIAFQSTRSGSAQIYIMPSVGGPATPFAGQPPLATWPAWSPDGQTLVFSGGVDQNHTQLYSVAAAGGLLPAPLTNNDRPAASPVWMPDGKALVFLLTRTDARHTLATIRPDGTGQHELTVPPAADSAVTPAPGSRPTNCPPEDLFPAPSPDGRWIAFFSNRTCNEEVFLTDSTGLTLTNLSNDPAGDVDPAWAPDSSRLVFASNRDGAYRLYVVARDGTRLTPLTQGTGDYDDTFPRWSLAH